MKPMNILRIILTVDPRYGGPTEAVKTSALEMKRLGHHTEVLSLDDPQSEYIKSFPVPVHGQKPLVRRYGYTPKIARWIRQNAHRFDIAIIEGVWNHSSIGGWQGLKAAGLPYVLFTHGMIDPWFQRHYPLKHIFKQFFWSALQGKVLRDAASVLFTCEEEKILASTAFVGPAYRSRVVSFGTADVPEPSPAQQEAFYRHLPQLRGKRFFLFLSRLHAKKGPDILLKAFAEIAGRNPDIDLVMAGPDSNGLTAELQTLSRELKIEGRVHWPGMMTGDAKWGAYREAEAFVLTSHSENFGIVVAEALACGTPVLISNKVNIWREIEASGAGLVVDDDVKSSVAMLSAWLALDAAGRERMRARTRACFEQNFHIEKATDNLLEVLSGYRGSRNAE
jgi:glycosyltransferase involved in cell wall biosynthesis